MKQSSLQQHQQQQQAFVSHAAKSAASKSVHRATLPAIAIAADILLDTVNSSGVVGGVAWQLEEAEEEDDDGGGWN